jgi:SAM-dependent methyltransferase
VRARSSSVDGGASGHGANVLRILAHLLFQPRQYSNRCIKTFASGIHNQRILELGSGKLVDGRDVYSARRYFDSSNDFVQSDVVEEYGHPIVDATRMDFDAEFDVVLCMSVLEHVYEYQQAIKNVRRALTPRGIAVVLVPCMYPMHDEPNDYWRFTEHALRRLLGDFADVRIQHKGPRAYPIIYYVEAHK